MAWTSIPATSATDWAKQSFFKQFWEALNERRTLLGQAVVFVPAVGCDCQYMGDGGLAVWPTSTTDKFTVQLVQKWVQDNCFNFVATIDSGLAPVTNYNGQATIEMWSWAKIQTRVLGGHAWTRKVPGGQVTGIGLSFTTPNTITDSGGNFVAEGFNVGDNVVVTGSTSNNGIYEILTAAAGTLTVTPNLVATEAGLTGTLARCHDVLYGVAVTGDYFGPWLWNELRLVFDELVWLTTTPDTGWTSSGWINKKTGESFGEATWAAAKTVAEANYDASGADGTTEIPYCFSEGHSTPWVAHIARLRAYGYAGAPDGGTLTKDTDWYVKGVAPTILYPAATFNANGDTITADGNWSLWTSQNGEAGASVLTTSLFGSLAYPIWIAEPGAGGDATGYFVDNKAVIWKYDVAGGFTYYT